MFKLVHLWDSVYFACCLRRGGGEKFEIWHSLGGFTFAGVKTELYFKMLNNAIKKIDLNKYRHAKYLLFIPLYMAIFWLEEKYITGGYFVSYMRLDSYIHFNEWFVIPYVLWYPLMIGAGVYLFLKDAPGFKNYMIFIGVGFLLIVIFYAIFPNGQNLRPRSFQNQNILTDIVKLLYKRDTNTNVLPSLHVVGTMGAMFALMKTKALQKWWIQTLNVVLAISICISTVFIKQHSILDVFTGVPLGFIYYFAVYKWLPQIKERLNRRKTVLIGH